MFEFNLVFILSCFCSILFLFNLVFIRSCFCSILSYSILFLFNLVLFDLVFIRSSFCSIFYYSILFLFSMQNFRKMEDARIFQMSLFQLKYCRDFSHAVFFFFFSWPHFIVDLRRQTRAEKTGRKKSNEEKK